MKFRSNNAGFTLIEALLAVVVLSMFAIPIFSSYTRSVSVAVKSDQELTSIEFARSMFEEISVTRDRRERSGHYKDRFFYTVSTEAQSPLAETRFIDLLESVAIRITVEDTNNTSETRSYTQVFTWPKQN